MGKRCGRIPWRAARSDCRLDRASVFWFRDGGPRRRSEPVLEVDRDRLSPPRVPTALRDSSESDASSEFRGAPRGRSAARTANRFFSF